MNRESITCHQGVPKWVQNRAKMNFFAISPTLHSRVRSAMNGNFFSVLAFHFGPFGMNLGRLPGHLGVNKWVQNRAKMDFLALFPSLQSKVRTAVPGNEVKYFWDIVDEPGKPHGPPRGSEIVSKSSNIGHNCTFFY